jgi:hypothetical protein
MTTPPRSVRANVVRSALEALASQGTPAQDIRITIRANGVALVYDVTHAEAVKVLGPVPIPGLSPRAVAILDHLTDTPQTAKTLARLTGYSLNSYFREGLKELVRAGVCVAEGGHYRVMPQGGEKTLVLEGKGNHASNGKAK